MSSSDGVKVSVQDADARSCSYDSTRFGASHSPHPVAAWASRVTDGETTACQGAGTYYVVVDRIDAAGSSSDDWDLELTLRVGAGPRGQGRDDRARVPRVLGLRLARPAHR